MTNNSTNFDIEHYRAENPGIIKEIIKDFSVFYLNINSIVSERRRDDFQLLIDDLGIKFDAILLVETYYKPDHGLLTIDGYKEFHSFREREGGGIFIFINEKHEADICFQRMVNEIEVMVVKVKGRLDLGLVYRPPVNNFDDFFEILDETLENRRNTVICGDFNIDVLKKNSNIKSDYLQ
jgi:exonuclease III